MTKSPEFIIFNEEIKTKKELSFYEVERFRYADACFESILLINGKIPLLNLHQERLNKTCEILDFEKKEIFLTQIKTLITAYNQQANYWRVRYSLIRNEGQNYSPLGAKTSVLIECAPIRKLFQNLDHLGLYTENYKANTNFAKFKTSNALIYVKAKQFAKANKYNDVLLKNENGFWIEASASNLFVVKNEKIYTSKKNSGAVEGVFSQFLQKYSKVEQINLTDVFLNDADEVFLTNAIQFIQPVKHFQGKMLQSKITNQLIKLVKNNLLNEA